MGNWTVGQREVVSDLIKELQSDGFRHVPTLAGSFSDILVRGDEVAKIYDDSAFDRYLDYVDTLDDATHHPIRLSERSTHAVAPYVDDDQFPCWGTNEAVRMVLLRREFPLVASSRFSRQSSLVYNRAFSDLVDSDDSQALETLLRDEELRAVINVIDFARASNLTCDLRVSNFATDAYERLVILDPVWYPYYNSEKMHKATIPMRYRTQQIGALV